MVLIHSYRFLTERQLSDAIAIKVATLRKWRLTDRGPKFLKVGGTLVRYRTEDVQAWLESCTSGGDRVPGGWHREAQ